MVENLIVFCSCSGMGKKNWISRTFSSDFNPCNLLASATLLSNSSIRALVDFLAH